MSYGVFGTDLVFSSPDVAAMERRAIAFQIERRMSDTWTVGGGAGAGLPGFMQIGTERYSIDPGWLISASMSWRLLDGRENLPFLLLSLTFGGSGALTHRQDDKADAAHLFALDIRAGLLVGKTFWDTLSPYAAVRLFGGPVFWERHGEAVVGTDTRHIQLAIGMSAALPAGVDLFTEIAPLPFGERAATVGAGLAL